MENITAAKEKFGALIEAQKKRVAAMRAQGDFVDYAALPQIGSPIGTILSSGGFFLMTLFFSQQNFDAFGWRSLAPRLAAWHAEASQRESFSATAPIEG